MEKVVIIMAAWNEAENIQKMITTLFDEIFPQIKAEMHIVVADNNSTDGMTEIVEKEMKVRNNLHIIQQGEKKGLGNAYVAGFKYAVAKLGADAVMEMDADGQHPPRFVKPMVEAYLNGADYVIGSRYIPGGSVPQEWPFFRRFGSFGMNLFIRLVLLKPAIHDLTTGFRLTRVKGVLDKIDLENLMEKERFAYKVDLLYQSVKNAQKVVEVPLEFRPRISDKSKFKIKEIILTIKVAIILGIKDKIRLIKFGTVGFAGYLVNAFFLYIFATRLNFPEMLAWAFSTEIAIVNNFTWNNLWTFREETISGSGMLIKKFLQFNLTSLGALVIQTVFGSLGVSILGPEYRQILLPFIVLFLVLPYNYFMSNVVIWKTWKLPFLSKLQKKVG